MFKSDEAVALGFSGGLVEDYDGLVELAEGGEDGAEGIGGGVGAEAADEELSEGEVSVGDGAQGFEDVRVANDGVFEDFYEMLVGHGLEELPKVFWG